MGVSHDSQLERLLEAVLLVAGDLDLESVLRRIVEAACSLVDARYGALGVIGEDGERLEQFIHVGLDQATIDKIGALPSGHGILGLLIEEPHAVRLERLSAHPRSYGFPPHHPPMDTFLGVPIRVAGTVFGNLYLTEKRSGDAFTQTDEDLVSALAAVAGAAIVNARMFDDVQRRELWHNAVIEVADALLTGVETSIVHKRIVALAARLVDADGVCLIVADGVDELEAPVVIDASWGNAPSEGPFDAQNLGARDVFATGDVVRREHGAAFDRPSLWVPIHDGQSIVAALGVGRQTALSTQEEVLLVGFGEQISLAWSFEQVQQRVRQLSIIEDRERIGRDLHDTVIQRLFATGLSLQALIRQCDGQPHVAARLTKAIDEIDMTVKEIRSTIFALQDAGNDERVGVRAQLLGIVDEVGSLLEAAPRVRFHGPIDTAAQETVTRELIPVVREALTNVAKHAQATDVEVDLIVAHGRLTLRVLDNGAGVAKSDAHGFGVGNMRERAIRLGGECFLSPRPGGRGTELTWDVPIDPAS